MSFRHFFILALMGILLGAGASALYKWYQETRLETEAPDGLGSLPQFTLNDLDGNPWRTEEWRGKVMVVNFWATWCPPCRREMPLFVRLDEKLRDRGVLFVGVAIDDPQKVRDFVDTYGIEFPILLGQEKGIELARRLGNRLDALPFTVVTDRKGRIHLRRAGEMTERTLAPLLERLAQQP